MAKKTDNIADAILTPATPAELIKGLIQALGHEPQDIASVDITATRVRVLGKDRSLRSHKVEAWNA